ncbi:MAG: hypothetical protein WEA56_10190 [Balneolaceae bacterium]
MSLISQYKLKKDSTPDIVARLASDLANPLIIPPVVFGVMGYSQHLMNSETVLLITLSAFFFTIIPAVTALTLAHYRSFRSLDFPERKSRTRLYGFTILSFIAGSIFIAVLFNESLIRLLTLIFSINLVCGFIINFKWKISAHCAALASGGIFLLLVGFTGSSGNFPSIATGFFLLLMVLPLVLWARYQIGIHSVSELAGGTVLGFLLTIFVFTLWFSTQ